VADQTAPWNPDWSGAPQYTPETNYPNGNASDMGPSFPGTNYPTGHASDVGPPMPPHVGPMGPMPTGAMPYDPSTANFDPVFLQNDCTCRGGKFVNVPGQPQNSYCIPGAVQTGKQYNFQTRGCTPINGYQGPGIGSFPSWCYFKGINVCLYGGIALGVVVLFSLLGRGRKTPVKQGRRRRK
jgi:hypothetical protein